MVDINQEAMRYAERRPYQFTRIRLPDRQKQIRGRFQITEQPDPMIAVMLGDFVHNLRTALDHIIVACVPKERRKSASFPIVLEDIWARDKEGSLMVKYAKRRDEFETAIDGLAPNARAFVIKMQPCSFGDLSNLITLGIISRLENADKHRQLITLGCGGKDFALSFTVRGLPEPIIFHQVLATGTRFLKDDTVIPFDFPSDFPPNGIPHPDGSFIQPSDMEVHLTGTVKILVEVTTVGGNQPPGTHLLDFMMPSALFEVGEILKTLEPFVID
ncbi:MAG: hypothetical protein HY680_01970 [Chloroflexi bacterium]|nr:hypothetical protein [Chloroflexota bacterium]